MSELLCFRDPEFEERPLSTSKQFAGYLKALDGIEEPIDVVIDDGRCRPQVADKMRKHLRENGILVIRGDRDHYKFISSYYSVVAKFPSSMYPGKEFSGMTVYRNDKVEKQIEYPKWW